MWVACRGLWELGEAAQQATYNNDVGMSFSELSTRGNGMGMLWLTFALEAPVLLLMAWYLEQVTDSGIGVRRSVLFPIYSLIAWYVFPGHAPTTTTPLAAQHASASHLRPHHGR